MIINIMKIYIGYHLICIIIALFFTRTFEQAPNALTKNFSPDSENQNSPSTVKMLPQQKQVISWMLQAQQAKLQSLQTLFKSSFPNELCPDFAKFTDQIQGLAKVAVWNSTLTINFIIQQQMRLNEQLNSLSNQLIEQEKRRDQIGLPRLKLALQNLFSQLQQKYTIIARANEAINSRRTELKNSSEELLDLKTRRDRQKQRLYQKNIQLELNLKQIQSLENELTVIKQVKSKIISQIKEVSTNISNKEYRIASLQKKTRQLQEQIHEMDDFQVKTNLESLSLEAQIQDSQNFINKVTGLYQLTLKKIQNDQQMIKNTQSQISHLPDLSYYTALVPLLTKFIENLKTISSSLYYNCFIKQKYPQKLTNSFYLSVAQLIPYLQSLYSNRVPLPEANNFFHYNLKVIDLFGRQWTENFGFPFDSQKLISSTLFLKDDYTCSTNKKFSESYCGRGTVIFVNQNSIEIKTMDGNKLILSMGACTRLQSSRIYPIFNDMVYFRGFFVTPLILSAYLITSI